MKKQQFPNWVEAAQKNKDDFAVCLIQSIVVDASSEGVSDLHFQPGRDGMEIWYRRDGVLHELGVVTGEQIERMVARLKVLANLLTYRTNIPQEGRVRAGRVPGVTQEMRISTIPTLYGERVVVRFFAEETRYEFPEQLGFSPELQRELLATSQSRGGAIIICGPAGSGKTTTAYALLRHLAFYGGRGTDLNEPDKSLRSIITLEDPVEHPIAHVAQVEVSQQSTVSLSDMIKFTMRQDPEVLFVGELRDKASATAAFQAALTGHLLVTTFHAGGVAQAAGRLSEMGMEPFVLRSSINMIVSQRLVRKLCDCARCVHEPFDLTLNGQTCRINDYRQPVGCDKCSHTG
ncbi:MAG: ATPase, T2SS/T4P/T4SS family, partial [Thermoguttaceae bacterium]|nr:ATPase, T2SS/T4P/T4SS family [Thermoguttaceae bacterium]